MMMMMMMITGIFTYGTNTYRYSYRRYFGCMPPSSSSTSSSSLPHLWEQTFTSCPRKQSKLFFQPVFPYFLPFCILHFASFFFSSRLSFSWYLPFSIYPLRFIPLFTQSRTRRSEYLQTSKNYQTKLVIVFYLQHKGLKLGDKKAEVRKNDMEIL